jgi:hypothetical protein
MSASYPTLPDERAARATTTTTYTTTPTPTATAPRSAPALHSAPASAAAGDVEMKPWGKHTAAASASQTQHPGVPIINSYMADPSSVAASAPPSTGSPADRGREGEGREDGLVHDLLDENARLKAELEEARRGRGGQAGAAQGPVVTGLSSTERAARAG